MPKQSKKRHVPQLHAQVHKNIQKVCRHEAGHYLVATKLGFGGLGITVEVNQDGSPRGASEMSPARSVVGQDQLVKYLKDRIAVLYAGAIAQCSKRGQVDGVALEQSLKTNSAGDYAKICELLALLRNITHSNTTSVTDKRQELTALDSELRTYSSNTVDEVEDALDELEDSLVNRFKPGIQFAFMAHTDILALPSAKRLFG